LKTADLTYLLNIAEGKNELIIEMIDIFVDQVGEFKSEMQDLYNKKDYDSLGKLAHKAKSSVAIMGMDYLAQKLKELELLCNEGVNSNMYPELISIFVSETELAIGELQKYKELQQL